RWSGRGQEAVAAFGSSEKALSSKDLKIAAKHSASQREVWDKVAQSQAKLSSGVVASDAAPAVEAATMSPAQGQVAAGGGEGTVGRFSVRSSLSSSSLQLSLENKNLKQVVDDYAKKLSPIIEGKNDVIGYVFAINGQINSADVYSSSALFKKLWPKLIESSATEAVGEFEKSKTHDQVKADAVKAFLMDAESGKADEKEVTSRVTSVKRETEKNLFFETRDRNRGKTWLHRNYLAK
ncbi:MAG: ARPP-1 family domain-containing protein, partial [Blastocatellia bacterium]